MEIVDTYYALEELVEQLQSLVKEYTGKVDNNYIEQMDALWCEIDNEKEMLEDDVRRIEQAENRQQEYEYDMCRI